MNTITGTVKTENGAKYVQQLCKHWSHKLQTEIDGDRGTVTFPSAVVEMTADAEGIAITITGENGTDLEPMTGVVANHLDRFAFREAPMAYVWSSQEAVG